MRATLVSLNPTAAASRAGRPALTPELLAATGARYSRSNEGLESILARIDPQDPDRSVDAIFRMIDYGHQSIADMAPLAIFIDGISAWMAWYVWSLCPLAGGQESSTRYIRIAPESLIDPEALGLPADRRDAWRRTMDKAFAHYADLLEGWTRLAEASPARLRLPPALRDDPSERGQKQRDRIRRNYAFDRARYLLPAALATNMMLVMSARAWAGLCRHLASHPLPEARALGKILREELGLGAPRMLRHANEDATLAEALREQFAAWAAVASTDAAAPLADPALPAEHPCRASLDVLEPPGGAVGFADALRFHNHRYAWIGPEIGRTAVRFGWEAVAFAEIRDLNRHRTGHKYCPPIPMGFYNAPDQLPQPDEADFDRSPARAVREAAEHGRAVARQAHRLLATGDSTSVYWTLLGTQFAFEHVTTGDKFIYEAELRTGLGAHYRYAQHLRDALALWYRRYPETRNIILEGSAEPE